MILVGYSLHAKYYNYCLQFSFLIKGSLKNSGHTHHHLKDSVADHVHQSEEEENLMERRLSGKFSGIQKMNKYKLLKPEETAGDEKAYIFNLF